MLADRKCTKHYVALSKNASGVCHFLSEKFLLHIKLLIYFVDFKLTLFN